MSEKQTLVSLTKSFRELISAAGGKEIELSQAETQLNANKRRLYDVTNVLVGIGLIERTGKSKVRWVGGDTSSQGNYHELLIEKEAKIDQLTQNASHALADLVASDLFQRYGWISEDDILSIDKLKNFSGLFSLQGPPSMTMTSYNTPGTGPNRIVCTTSEGEIHIKQICEKQPKTN